MIANVSSNDSMAQFSLIFIYACGFKQNQMNTNIFIQSVVSFVTTPSLVHQIMPLEKKHHTK